MYASARCIGMSGGMDAMKKFFSVRQIPTETRQVRSNARSYRNWTGNGPTLQQGSSGHKVLACRSFTSQSRFFASTAIPLPRDISILAKSKFHVRRVFRTIPRFNRSSHGRRARYFVARRNLPHHTPSPPPAMASDWNEAA